MSNFNKQQEFFKLFLVPLLAIITGIASENQLIEWFSSIAGIITGIPIIVEWMKVKWNFADKKFWKFYVSQWASYGVAVVMVYSSWAFRLGMEELTLSLLTIIKLLGAGLLLGFASSQAWFKLEWVQLALARLFGRLEKIQQINRINFLKKKLEQETKHNKNP